MLNILVAAACAASAAVLEPPASGMPPARPIEAAGRSWTYALYVPAGHDPRAPLPLVLCLHGFGFTGDTALLRWQPRLGERYLIACPTHPQAQWWTPESEALAVAVIEDVSSKYLVDSDRVFLTGMSNGGVGALWIGARQAERFAGVAPMAASFEADWYPLLARFKSTPLYIIHGSRDQVMPVAVIRDVVAELRRLGAAVVYREHDRVHPRAGGHFFPEEEVPALVDWFDSTGR